MPITVYYSSAATLRDELGVSNVVLPDDAANRLIRKAEGEVDRLIGVRPTDDTTGRDGNDHRPQASSPGHKHLPRQRLGADRRWNAGR